MKNDNEKNDDRYRDNFKSLNDVEDSFTISQHTSETFTADLVGTEDTKLEEMEALDLVTDLASLANLLSPATNQHQSTSQSGQSLLTTDLLRLVLDGLFEGGDVPEGAEEQDHHVPLILDRRDVHQQPQRGP